MHTDSLQHLINVLKYKVKNNICYYIVKNDFKTDVLNIFRGAILIPTILTGVNEEELYFSVIYKVEPSSENIDDINEVGEGLIKINYEVLASLIISNKVVPYYVDINKEDREINKILSDIRGL